MSRGTLRLGRGLFGLIAAGFVLFVASSLGRVPPVVASHFDGAGNPNGWSSRPVYASLLLVIGVILPLSTIGLVNLLTRQGPERLNIPARPYWIRPENGGEAVRRVRAYMWWLGCIMTGTAGIIHGLILRAHGQDPPRLGTSGIVVVIAGVVLAIGLWIVGWYLLLRPPAGRVSP